MRRIMTALPTPSQLMLALAAVMAAPVTSAQDTPPGIVGKNDWLFYRHEFIQDIPQSEVSVALVGKIAKILEANGTTVMVALAPIKSRIYAEHLPANWPLTPALQSDYERLSKKFKEAGVHTADINTAFLNSPKRTGEFPLYFRQDTHWSATGALLAAEAVRDAIVANPTTKKAYDATPVVKQSILWATQKFPFTGDIVGQMAAGSPKYEKELATAFEVRKESAGASLLGVAQGGIALLGSSYTANWTHFPKSIEYVLQRDVPAISVNASLGQWVGLDTYLRDDGFQVGRPRLLIWEMPERDLKAAPSMPYREARYVLENDEWLTRVAALALRECTPAANNVSLGSTGLSKGKTGKDLSLASTGANDFVELNFSQTTTNTEYLSASLLANGSKSLTVEASGPGVPTKKFMLDLAGDENEHALKTPLFSKTKGYTKVRLYPGDTKGFALKGLGMCRQPDGLLG